MRYTDCNQQKESKLVSLPREVLDNIVKLVVVNSGHGDSVKLYPGYRPPLMDTCKYLRCTTLHALYGNPLIEESKKSSKFKKCCEIAVEASNPAALLANLRSLSLEIAAAIIRLKIDVITAEFEEDNWTTGEKQWEECFQLLRRHGFHDKVVWYKHPGLPRDPNQNVTTGRTDIKYIGYAVVRANWKAFLKS